MVGALRPDRVKRRSFVMGSAVFLLLAGGLVVVLIPYPEPCRHFGSVRCCFWGGGCCG